MRDIVDRKIMHNANISFQEKAAYNFAMNQNW